MDIGEIKYLEAPAKVLKLSEAIRIGSKIRPQGSTRLFREGKSCVWGAACEAMGGKYKENAGFDDLFEVISVKRFVAADEKYKKAFGLNSWWDNDNGISREQIADRFEAIGL